MVPLGWLQDGSQIQNSQEGVPDNGEILGLLKT